MSLDRFDLLQLAVRVVATAMLITNPSCSRRDPGSSSSMVQALPRNAIAPTTYGITIRRDSDTIDELRGQASVLKLLIDNETHSAGRKFTVSLEPAAECSRLQYLYISDLTILSLEPLASLAELRQLMLVRCSVHDWSQLSNLAQLDTLRVGGSDIDTLEPIRVMSKLRSLDIGHAKIDDLSSLHGHPSLRRLILNRRRFTIEQLQSLKASVPGLMIEHDTDMTSW